MEKKKNKGVYLKEEAGFQPILKQGEKKDNGKKKTKKQKD